MAVLVAVGLDGREIPPETIAPDEPMGDLPEGLRYDIEIFDLLPKWAREALREWPGYDVRANELAPYIVNGTVNRFNIHAMLSQNDRVIRAFFKEKDRADGIA